MHPTAQLEFVKKQIKTKAQPYYNAYVPLINAGCSVARKQITATVFV